MANALTTVVKSFVDDTTDAITGKVGPLMEGFTRKTGDIVAQNAGDIDATESDVTTSVQGVMKNGDGGPQPGDLDPGGAAAGANPGDLAPPAAAGSAPAPVDTQGVGPCGKAGEPVDVVRGQYVTAHTDLELPGVLPLVLRRAYASGYRGGRLLGPGWSSTLDIRVQITAAAIHFADDDCRILDYPHPVPGHSVHPDAGERLPLTWDRQREEILVHDTASGRTWHFTTAGSGRGGADGSDIRPLTAISDRNGNRIVVQRDPDGLPTEVRHSGGYRVAVDTGFTAAGLRVQGLRLLDGTNDGRGTTVRTFQYDPRGRLLAFADSRPRPFVYEHDDADRITAWIDRAGYRFSYTYDQAGRVVRTGGADGTLSGTFAYHPENRVTIYTDSFGQPTEHHYDEHGYISRSVGALGHATTRESDPYGRLLSATDALGATTRYTLNEHGDPIRVEQPDGSAVVAEYNALRKALRVTEPGGSTWSYEYDDRGNLLRATDPAGAASTFAYCEHGAVTSAVDAQRGTTAYERDRAGLAAAVTDPLGTTVRVERDAFGRTVAVRDQLGRVSRAAFTPEGRPLRYQGPGGERRAWIHAPDGRRTECRHADGAVTVREYGPFGELTAATGRDGVRRALTYDSELRLVEVAHGPGRVWSYAFGPTGYLVGETDYNGRRLRYAHDAAGRLARRVNGAGEATEFERDVFGRTVRRTCGGTRYTFDYDRSGHLAAATGPDCELRFVRTTGGRLAAEVYNGRETGFEHDALGRPTRRTTPTGVVSQWAYTADGRPLSLSTTRGSLSFGYDEAGGETARYLGPGAALTQSFHPSGLLAGQSIWAYDQPGDDRPREVQRRTYAYRDDGVPVEIADRLRGDCRFDLDRLGRATAVHGAGWSENYAYDALGNVTRLKDDRPRTAPGADVLGTLVRRSRRTTFEHDGQGRVVRIRRRTLSGQTREWRFSWDADDHLVSAATPDGDTWQYAYDPLGRRTVKRHLAADGTRLDEYWFTWDGPRLAEQCRTASDGRVHTVTWDWEPGTHRAAAQTERSWPVAAASAAQGPQADIDARFFAIVTDLSGAPAELVAPDGRIAWRAAHDLWGAGIPDGPAGPAGPADSADSANSAGSATGCPLRFPGQYHDPETGLHYNLHRYFDPESAAFTSPDPLGLAPAPNQHSYVPNPLVWADPLGLAVSPRDRALTGMNHMLDEADLGKTNHLLNGVDDNEDHITQYLLSHTNDTPAYFQKNGSRISFDYGTLDASGNPMVLIHQTNMIHGYHLTQAEIDANTSAGGEALAKNPDAQPRWTTCPP